MLSMLILVAKILKINKQIYLKKCKASSLDVTLSFQEV